MQGRQILTQAQLQAHVTQLSNQDIIWAPLYDANTYVGTTGHLALTFFLAMTAFIIRVPIYGPRVQLRHRLRRRRRARSHV